jgi:hypothetical protein
MMVLLRETKGGPQKKEYTIGIYVRKQPWSRQNTDLET